MINRICSRCGRILPVGERCSCQPAYRRDYNRFRRDKKIASFRASAEWRQARQAAIERDNGTDQYVLHTTGALQPGFSVHHILPLSTPDGWARRTDLSNLITLGSDTHSTIEYRYKTKFKEQLQLQQELFEIVQRVTEDRARDNGGD